MSKEILVNYTAEHLVFTIQAVLIAQLAVTVFAFFWNYFINAARTFATRDYK